MAQATPWLQNSAALGRPELHRRLEGERPLHLHCGEPGARVQSTAQTVSHLRGGSCNGGPSDAVDIKLTINELRGGGGKGLVIIDTTANHNTLILEF